MKRILLAAAYLGSIVAAAWAITHVGTQYAPGAPHVLLARRLLARIWATLTDDPATRWARLTGDDDV